MTAGVFAFGLALVAIPILAQMQGAIAGGLVLAGGLVVMTAYLILWNDLLVRIARHIDGNAAWSRRRDVAVALASTAIAGITVGLVLLLIVIGQGR
jgi:hypothetical protein